MSKLLSLGATHPTPVADRARCPLAEAVSQGFVGVVRVLVNQGGMKAVGGNAVLPNALYRAVRAHQARILQLLLAVHGEERRWEWANSAAQGRCLLHYGAGHCCPASVSVLLQAGADEAARDPEGHTPGDVIGACIRRDGELEGHRGKAVAIRLMLPRGPAYRARSWAWPSEGEAYGVGGSSDNGTAAAAAAAAAAVLSSPPGVNAPSVKGVRIFRPNQNSSSKFFARLIGRRAPSCVRADVRTCG